MPSLAVLFDQQSGQWLRFTALVEELEVHHMAEVLPTIELLEKRVETEGLYAAGFVSYEAAPAFDEALTTRAAKDVPLLRFGLFAAMERTALAVPGDAVAQFNWTAEETLQEFNAKVERIQAAIAEGETYQVNLTFPLSCRFAGDPWQFFTRLAVGQRARGAGFLQSDRWAVCSASPELFFVRCGDQLTMRPMKGTAPRGRSAGEDQEHARALAESAKNRAENIMILDMVRNDLGRLAPAGRVRTEAICSLEQYPTVWQLTSTVTAQSHASLAEIFRALFPCASITGAPKAKTMEIIAATEARPRGLYTGTFGWLSPGRQAQFNVAIRTALIDRQAGCASYGVGAGITWDSIGEAEYRECLDKAAILSCPQCSAALIETLLWTPGKGYFILPEHLTRLQSSAEYFDYPCATEHIREYLQGLADHFPATPQRVRFLLHPSGQFEATSAPLDVRGPAPLKIKLARNAIHSRDRSLFHKTTQRRVYEDRLAQAGDADEVVLWNERGEVTECCTANLVIEKEGRLVTPPVDCGLLPGTYRASLLRRGTIEEQVVTREELLGSPRIYLINAVRKWRRAVITG